MPGQGILGLIVHIIDAHYIEHPVEKVLSTQEDLTWLRGNLIDTIILGSRSRTKNSVRFFPTYLILISIYLYTMYIIHFIFYMNSINNDNNFNFCYYH